MNSLNYETVRMIVSDYMKYGNYAERTIDSVLKVLKQFNVYLAVRKINDYRDVTQAEYYGFLEYSEETSEHGIKKTTLSNYGGILRKIFSILEEEEKILINPFNNVDGIKAQRSIRDSVLTEKQMEEILNSIDAETPLGFRDRTVFEMLYGTGIRARELCGLEIYDFLREEKMLFIRNGKGRKDRVLPIGNNTYEYLTRYIRDIRPKFLSRRNKAYAKYLFLNSYGKKLAAGSLKEIFRKVRENYTKLNHTEIKVFSPHVIRHTFATHLINAGADIREVQLLLGHSSIKSTEVYLNLSTRHLKEVYEKYHPLENELYFDAVEREKYIFDLLKNTALQRTQKFDEKGKSA